jgi:hypothetical protein
VSFVQLTRSGKTKISQRSSAGDCLLQFRRGSTKRGLDYLPPAVPAAGELKSGRYRRIWLSV